MRQSAVIASFLLFAACASSAAVDLSPRRVTGSGGDVRVDAEIGAGRDGEPIAIKYEITNERPAPITIVDVTPETTFDVETHTATVKIGLAAPGSTTRLVRIAPGEKKSFRTTARLAAKTDPANPTQLRLQVNFLDDGRPESVYTNAISAYR